MLCWVEDVEGGHSDVVNWEHFELKLHCKVSVMEVPYEDACASGDDP